MSYHVHRTPAIVLGSVPRGDAHRSLTLFTAAFGCVGALARGIRHERSKLRFALQEYARAEVSLVYGRGGWRVTGADRSANVYLRLVHQPHQRNAYVRIIRLLRRLLQGQERNDYLFAVIDTLTDVFVHRALSADACADAERLTVLRMLHALGYVAPAEPFADVLHTDALTPAMLDIARAKRRSIVREINRALRESHL